MICKMIYILPYKLPVMVKKGKGKVVKVGPARTRYITIPSTIATDSQFPFTDNEEVSVEILPEKGSLVISRVA